MTTAVLTLNRDCPWNTTITDFNGVTQYDVSTSAHKSELRTVVRNHRDETIATLQWRDFLPDRIELGGRSMMVDQWLTKSIVPLKYTASMKDDLGRRYVWCGNAPGLKLQLYTAEDRITPIAYLEKSQGDAPATITLHPRAEQIRDTVVVAAMFLDKARQVKEKAYRYCDAPTTQFT